MRCWPTPRHQLAYRRTPMNSSGLVALHLSSSTVDVHLLCTACPYQASRLRLYLIMRGY
ncbi:hypothetical protein BD779DRAFT_621264 [Infundibulicybe gibba]|nr:hypothetical protein BD779DRAFT_621264 [Infundibulicybe gibba]